MSKRPKLPTEFNEKRELTRISNGYVLLMNIPLEYREGAYEVWHDRCERMLMLKHPELFTKTKQPKGVI